MPRIEQLPTSKAIEYLGVSRATFYRYRDQGRIKPVDTRGQTLFWSVGDLESLRLLLQGSKVAQGTKLTYDDTPEQLLPGRSGHERHKAFEEALTMVKGFDLATPHLDTKEAKQMISEGKTLNKTFEQHFRLKAAQLLEKSNALEMLVADMLSGGPKERLANFQAIAKIVLPNLSSISVEGSTDASQVKKKEVMDQAVKLIKAAQKQLKYAPVGEVMEAEVLESA